MRRAGRPHIAASLLVLVLAAASAETSRFSPSPHAGSADAGSADAGSAASRGAAAETADTRRFAPGWTQEGRISYYGSRFAAKPTASGEPFDPDAMTMAHRSLPFGSVVRVRNLRNGRSVELRVNDRGPYEKSRIADVSRAAARELGMLRRGVVRARIELLRVEDEARN